MGFLDGNPYTAYAIRTVLTVWRMRFCTTSIVLVASTLSIPVHAAYPTKVLSAIEKTKTLPDVHVGVGYEFGSNSAQITREWIQVDSGTGDRSAMDVKEADYTNLVHRLLIDLRVGVFRDLELHLRAPIIISDTSELNFSEGVSGSSTVYGSANANDPNFAMGDNYRFPITQIPAKRKRAGFGDMTFGLSWSPLNDLKDEAFPTLTLTGDIIAPTGSLRDPTDQDAVTGSGGVGSGQTKFDLSIGVSRRMRTNYPLLDPYMLFGATIPVATAAQKQLGMEPPPSGRFIVGTEVVIHEELEERVRYGIDLSFSLQYIGLGRTYSELSDYLPNFNRKAVDSDSVDYVDYANKENYAVQISGADCLGVDPNSGQRLLADVPCGELNKVDEHLRMRGQIAIHIQPSKYFLLRTGFALGFTTDHLITAETVGNDLDPPDADDTLCPGGCVGRVNARNSTGSNEELSEYYDPRYDAPGRRFRAEDIVNLMFFLNLAVTF